MSKQIKISFKAALISLTLLLILLVVMIMLPWMGYYHYNLVKRTTMEVEFAHSRRLVELVESDIKQVAQFLENKSLPLARLIHYEPIDLNFLQDFLDGTLNQQSVIEGLFFIDPEQNLLAGSYKTVDSAKNTVDASASFSSLYSETLHQRVLELKSSIENNFYKGLELFQDQNKTLILFPVFYEGQLKGILLANLNTLALWQLANANQNSGQVENFNRYYLFNKSGEAFLPLDSSLESANKSAAEINRDTNLTKGFFAYGDFKRSKEPFLIKGEQSFFLLSPFMSLDIALLTQIPSKVVTSHLYKFITPAIFLLTALAALVITFGLFALPFFLKPLHQLKAAFSETSGFAEESKIAIKQLPHSPITEFDELVKSFKIMHQARLLAEQSLRDSEENLSVTLHSIGDAVITTDALGYITRMNPIAETLTGWKETDALQQPLTKVFHIINAKSRSVCENPVQKVIKTGAIIGLANHTALISRGGSEYQIADSAAPIINNGDIIGVILVFRDVTEEYRLREAELESQKFLSGLVNDMETMLGVLDINGTLTFANNTPLIAAGITEAEVIGKKFWETPWFEGLKDTQQKVIDAIKQAAKGQSSFQLFQAKMRNGLMWIEFNIHPVFDDEGEVKYLVPEGRDVSQRILAEKQLEKNKLQAQTIFDNTSSLIFVKDLKGRYLVVNKSLERFFGVDKDAFFGKTDIEIFGEGEQEKVWRENFQQVLNEGRVVEFEEDLFFNNKHFTFISTKFCLYDMEDEPYAFCGISTDISDRVQMERKLRASELRLRQHRQQTPVAIIESDSDFKIIDWNPSAERIFGFSKEEALGKTLIEVLIPEESQLEFGKNCTAFITEKQSQQHFFTNRNKQGDILYCEWFCSPLFDLQGDLYAITAEVVDKTAEKHQEEQLRRSQKMDALGKLTGGIAHDFNNMLGVVMGYAEMIESSERLDPDLRKYLTEILNAGKRGERLTKKLLAFSRQKRARSSSININELLLDDQNMLEKVLTARIKLTLSLAPELWIVNVDKSDLEDAILNMSINAQQAITGNGELVFATENIILNTEEANFFEVGPGEYVKLEIKDTGVGIAGDIIDKIFEPFFTTKEDSGNGLGLSQVYGFMQRSLGAIKVNSKPGFGAVFTLLFPRSLEKVLPITDSEENNRITPTKMNSEKILVVDDEFPLRELAKDILSRQGYEVVCAQNGRQAMEVLARNEVALIVTDVIMPVMDGYQLAKKVNEKYPEIKVLLTSGFTDRRSLDELGSQLYNELLPKPYSSKELLNRVNELLMENQEG